MLQTILTAIALLFVLEGILPFLCPQCWRKTFFALLVLNNRSIRIMGFISMVIGTLLIYLINYFYLSAS